MVHDLQGIAKRLGIATKFVDAGMIRREYEVSDETLRFFINSFGYDASNDEAIANSLHRLENARWHQALENIYVVEAGNVIVEELFHQSVRVPWGHHRRRIPIDKHVAEIEDHVGDLPAGVRSGVAVGHKHVIFHLRLSRPAFHAFLHS